MVNLATILLEFGRFCFSSSFSKRMTLSQELGSYVLPLFEEPKEESLSNVKGILKIVYVHTCKICFQ